MDYSPQVGQYVTHAPLATTLWIAPSLADAVQQGFVDAVIEQSSNLESGSLTVKS